jgi:hypothetical protein
VSCGVWRRQAPSLFRTELIQGLVSFGVAEGSAYRKTLEGLRAENTAYIAGAGNPAEVADAIEQGIRADDPPARVVVGEDAQSGSSSSMTLTRTASPSSCGPRSRPSPIPNRPQASRRQLRHEPCQVDDLAQLDNATVFTPHDFDLARRDGLSRRRLPE